MGAGGGEEPSHPRGRASDATADTVGWAPAEDHKSPENYFRTYKKRGLPGLGLLRAVRNICAHAGDYVADGQFGSVEGVWEYWLGQFPWLPLEVRCAADVARAARG